jgi:Reverse transcriptase (RNA-dependent DNA polymerase)
MPAIENLDQSALDRAFHRLRNATGQFERLLVRDPTDFLDFRVQLKPQIEALMYELKSGTYVPRKPVLHPYPKSKGINRPTVVFDIRDALVYRFCVEQIEDELISKTRMNSNIRGGVKIAPNLDPAADGYYEKFFADWLDHNEAIRQGLETRPVAATTDIASYFEGIDIPLLIDLVRGTVEGKASVVSLLDFFLRHSRVQYDYALNTNTGLPQEDIDCSRTLAYFYLHPHDNRIVEYALSNDSELFRFADDITILTHSEAGGRFALKSVTDSLRELGLVASIEKTEVMQSASVIDELMYAENGEFAVLEERIVDAAKKGAVPEALAAELTELYKRWTTGDQVKKKSWRKVLKRFYTAASLCRAPFLLDEFEMHVVDYPMEIHDKIVKYLVRIQRKIDLDATIARILSYLDSDENLYPSLETVLIESFLHLDEEALPKAAHEAIGAKGRQLALGGGQEPLSEYARALGCLLCFRFHPDSVNEIADEYLKGSPRSSLLRKYLAFVALTAPDETRRSKVLARARAEQDPSLNRLIGMVESLDSLKSHAAMKAFLKRSKLYYVGLDVTEDYKPVRQAIVESLIALYA